MMIRFLTRILKEIGIKRGTTILIALIFTTLLVLGWINIRLIDKAREAEYAHSQIKLASKYLESLKEAAEGLQRELISFFKEGKFPKEGIKTDIARIETLLQLLKKCEKDKDIFSKIYLSFCSFKNCVLALLETPREELFESCLLLEDNLLKAISEEIRKNRIKFVQAKINLEKVLKETHKSSLAVFVSAILVVSLLSIMIVAGVEDCVNMLTGYLNNIVEQVRNNLFPVKVQPLGRTGPELGKIMRSISELVEVLNESVQKIENLSKAKTAFLAIVSHELRTPLTPIIGFSELLLQENLPEEVKENLKIILTEAKKLSNMIERILSYSRLDSEPRLMETSLNSLLLDETNAVKPTAERKKLNLIIDLPKKEILTITDPHRLTLALREILNNAIKFTKKGYIKLSLKTTNKSAIITVEDSGEGIPEDKEKLIFDLFTQSENFLKRQHEGIGIGLPLALRAIKSIGGSLRFESELGKGSKFYIEIPLKGGESLDKDR